MPERTGARRLVLPGGHWHGRLGLLVRLAAVVFVAGWALSRWDSQTGFTAMPRFGERFAERRLPALAGYPIAPSAGDGYDGQWYAQLAVNPRVTDTTVLRALDKPAYRARRIAVPLLAHLLGAGAPWRTLQLFLLLHVAAWCALAVLLWRRLPPGDWRATAAWCGAVLGTGALDSLRMTLTDLPAVLGLVLAIRAVEAHRMTLATAAMLLAGFTRELSLGGLLALQRVGDRPWGGWGIWWRRAAIAVPVVAWCGWLLLRTPGAVGHEGNITWPGLAMAQHLAFCVRRVAAGDHDGQWWFGLIGGLALAAQSGYVLRRWREAGTDPWLALALPFAALFWLLGPDPWVDYRAVARDCLPMTVGFAMHWWRSDARAPWLVAHLPLVADGLARTTWP